MKRRSVLFISSISAAFLLSGGIVGGGSSARAAETSASNRWIKLHEQQPTDVVRFRRQAHGGSCFDSKRGQLLLFGSDTHRQDWTNSPLLFDVSARQWHRTYASDEPATYAVNDNGIPVAGMEGQHPWAMHTFGAVLCDPSRDEMIVASAPKHNTDRFKELLPKISSFPTWTFQLGTGQWQPLPGKAVDFFPYCAAFDSDRNVVLGYREDGIYELSGEPRAWKRLTKKSYLRGYHHNCDYDAQQQALVVFGTSQQKNDVEVYFPAIGKHQIMPTPGIRPPSDQHTPMAYHAGIGKTVVIVDRQRDDGKTVAETWLYDLGQDAWTQLSTATLPFGCGMNYNLAYDSRHDQLLLVTGEGSQPTTVWALQIVLLTPHAL